MTTVRQIARECKPCLYEKHQYFVFFRGEMLSFDRNLSCPARSAFLERGNAVSFEWRLVDYRPIPKPSFPPARE